MSQEWSRWESEGRPLDIGPVIMLDASGPVDPDAISRCAALVNDALSQVAPFRAAVTATVT
jgi:hypothetical protein